MGRTWAIIERELRRFRRSPMLIVVSMVAIGEAYTRPSRSLHNPKMGLRIASVSPR